MQKENNRNLFNYLEDTKQASKNKLINLGILIDSGGVIGILSISKAKPDGDLKLALLFFIMSICSIFFAELITMKVANDSLLEIVSKDISNEEVEIKDLRFYKTWISNLIWFVNTSAFFLGFYGIHLCFNYLK